MVAEVVTTVALAGIVYLILLRFNVWERRVPVTVKEKKALASEEQRTDELFAEGERLLKVGRFQDAERMFLEVKRRQPPHPKLNNRLGVVYLERGEYARAVEAFEESVREDPGKASRHANVSVAYRAMKKFTLARKALERALALEPGNEKYKRLKEELEQELGG
jgi:tetratricopeptide (TPR) repeat protein